MKRISLFTFLFVFLFLGSQVAYACMCYPPDDPYKVSKAVFFGKLIQISSTDQNSPRILTFRIEKDWKGIETGEVTVLTPQLNRCGYNFETGEKYLIYAGELNGKLETSPCRILFEDVAGDDLKKLGRPKRTIAQILSISQSRSKDDQTLKALVDQMITAQTEYDAKTLDKILTADYIEISPVGEFDPREKVLGFYNAEAKAAAASLKASVEATEHSIRNYGKFAVVIARLNYTMTMEGKPLPPRSIRVTYVMRKEGKMWKIASAQYTGIRPPQKSAGTAMVDANKLEVRLPVTVTLKRNPVSGLTKEDFEVFEDGVKQKVLSFSDEQNNPTAYVGVLMDTGSSTTDKLAFLKEAASNFTHTVTRMRKDKAAFMTFSDSVILWQDFTDKLDRLQQAINRVKETGKQAALYDAVWQMTDERLRNAPGRRVLAIVSNGGDTIGKATLIDAIDIAQRTDTTIFAISTRPLHVQDESDALLVRLCEETGGTAFFADDMLNFERSFSKIAEAIRSQYVLTYRPTNLNFDGRPRKVEVRFTDAKKRTDMVIRTKPSYRALRNMV